MNYNSNNISSRLSIIDKIKSSSLKFMVRPTGLALCRRGSDPKKEKLSTKWSLVQSQMRYWLNHRFSLNEFDLLGVWLRSDMTVSYDPASSYDRTLYFSKLEIWWRSKASGFKLCCVPNFANTQVIWSAYLASCFRRFSVIAGDPALVAARVVFLVAVVVSWSVGGVFVTRTVVGFLVDPVDVCWVLDTM